MPRPRSTEARSKILRSASEVLLAMGVAGFTVDEVCRRSGVAKTTIYRHFTNANRLLVTALDQLIVPLPSPDTGSLRSDLLAFIELALPAFSDAKLRPILLGLLAASAYDNDLQRVHEELVAERTKPVKEIFDNAIKRGELSEKLDFDVAVDLLEGPFIARWMLRPDSLESLDHEAVVDRVIAAWTAEIHPAPRS